MKLVIDLPEELFNYITGEGFNDHLDRRFDFKIRMAVKDGRPMPKNHGRLIDADHFKDVALLHSWHGNDKNIVPYSDRKGYRLRDNEVLTALVNAPTIIEADREKKIAESGGD